MLILFAVLGIWGNQLSVLYVVYFLRKFRQEKKKEVWNFESWIFYVWDWKNNVRSFLIIMFLIAI